jgi:hypothetical protein
VFSAPLLSALLQGTHRESQPESGMIRRGLAWRMPARLLPSVHPRIEESARSDSSHVRILCGTDGSVVPRPAHRIPGLLRVPRAPSSDQRFRGSCAEDVDIHSGGGDDGWRLGAAARCRAVFPALLRVLIAQVLIPRVRRSLSARPASRIQSAAAVTKVPSPRGPDLLLVFYQKPSIPAIFALPVIDHCISY